MPSVNLINGTGKKWDSGFTTQNTLSTALLRKPEVLEDITYIWGDKYLLSCLTQGTGRMSRVDETTRDYKLVGSDTVRWFLQGYLGKLVNVYTAPSNNGLNSIPFTIELEEDYFKPGDMARFPSGVHAYVMGEGQFNGHGYVYQMQLPKKELILTSIDLSPNAKLAFGYSAFPELSDQGYSRQFYPDAYENYMTILRKGAGISGSAITDVTWIGTKDKPKNKIWWSEQEHQFLMQWFQDLEYFYWFGQKSMNTNGTADINSSVNGRPVKTGSGVFEQLQYSIRRSYIPGLTNFAFWDDLLKDLIINSNSATGKKWVMCGGSELVSEFNRAMRREVPNLGTVTNIFTDVNGNEITMKGQFVKYVGLFGAEITVAYCPMFDNPSIFGGNLHPRTGKPMQSYTGVILDFGDYGGTPNVQYLAKGADGQDRRLIRKEIAGMHTLAGGKGSEYSANSIDGTRIEYLTESMIVIKNPFSCAVVEALLS